MNLFEKFLYNLQGTMNTPTAYGLFHLICILVMLFLIFTLYLLKNKYNEKQFRLVLAIYGYGALILEILKQLIWSFEFDAVTGLSSWNYQWYAFPFQLCTTPIYVCLICLYLKKGRIRTSLLSYLSFVTILGSIATILMPDSCFTSSILVNVHTMWLHLGSFIISIYLLISGEVKITKKNFNNAIKVFCLFVSIAYLLNILVYNILILNGEEFNMFYISPYFKSSLPIFNTIQDYVPHFIYLIIYIFALIVGAYIIFIITKTIKKFFKRKRII
ncbi:MAG: hypothetical protein E7167_04105 [Firmicutes bacterium]|nr:hypothetical protein [Bacillota bacterium]